MKSEAEQALFPTRHNAHHHIAQVNHSIDLRHVRAHLEGRDRPSLLDDEEAAAAGGHLNVHGPVEGGQGWEGLLERPLRVSKRSEGDSEKEGEKRSGHGGK